MTTEEWHPGTLLELSGYFWKTCTLHAAVKLDVFTLIGDKSLTAEELAGNAGTDADAMTRLADALVSMALLSKKNDRYSNTPPSARFLSKSSPEYIGYMVLHHHYLVELWRRLDESVQTGKPVRVPGPDTDETGKDDAEREAFLMGMFNNANLIAPNLVTHVDLQSRRRLLDMGGGPGTYAIYFCRQYPNLTATVFDLPGTKPFAEKTIARFGMTGRIDFQSGSYLDQELPAGYDAVWMSHILHGEGYDECVRMIEKAHRAMESGGIIIIHDFILTDSRTTPLFPALFSLNMLVATENGRAYTESEIITMLETAGFTKIRRLPYSGQNGAVLLTGIK